MSDKFLLTQTLLRFHSDTFLLALPFHWDTKLNENIKQDLPPK